MTVLLWVLVTVLLVQFAAGEVLSVGEGMDDPASCVQSTDKNAYRSYDGDEYTAEADLYSEKTERTTETCIPGLVQSLTSEVSGQNVTISWLPPEEDLCEAMEYNLIYKDETYTTNLTSYTFEYMEFCSTHEISVAAVSSEGQSGENSTVYADTDADLGMRVQNLQISITDDILNATWEPPAYAENCVSNYVLTVWDQNVNTADYETTNTFFEISPVVPCKTYNIQVKPRINQTSEGNVALITEEIGPMPTNPPQNVGNLIIDTTWAQLTWSTDSYSTNMCNITEIEVRCEALENENQDKDWIISSASETLNVTDDRLRPNVAITVSDLSEFTNYTCYAVVINTGGESNPSEPVKLQTKEGLTSEPLNLNVSNVTSSGFLVTWEEPWKVPGILQDYSIVIEAGSALHFIPEECQIADSDEAFVNDTTLAGVMEYSVDSALAHYGYTIRVSASTGAGRGQESSIDVNTTAGAPEEPRNLTYITLIEEIVDYNVSALITWQLPCNTNGELEYFVLAINGTPTFEGAESVYENISIAKNSIIENTAYEYTISKIQAAYEYTVGVFAVLDDDTEGDSVEINFTSPDGYPGAPTLNNISNIRENSFDITWSEPDIKNGNLVNYSVVVQSNGPLYLVPEFDDCNTDTKTYTSTVDPNKNSFNFADGLPYYSYVVSIRAGTSAGYGPQSNTQTVFTLQTAPEGPHSIGSHFEILEVDLTNYNVSATIEWTLPCKSNGQLEYFLIETEGISNYDSGRFNDSQKVLFDPTSAINYTLLINDLRAAYDYTFSVEAVLNNGYEGESNFTEFTTPDGYPGAPQLHEVSEIENSSFYVSWSEPAVKNGRLVSYNLYITNHGALYSIPDDAECTTDESNFTFPLDSNETFFNFNNGSAFHNYSIVISAATSLGFGAVSDIIFVNTKQAVPDEVRNLEYQVEVQTSEIYSAALSLSYSPPCHTYGELQNYEIKLTGKRSGFEDHIVTEYNLQTVQNITGLQPEYDYLVELTVISEEFNSTTSVANFSSPPGVPLGIISTNFESPTVNSSSTAVFEFSNDLFDDSNGEILYYAIILGSAQSNEESTFGFWNGTAESWPTIGDNSRRRLMFLRSGVEAYQATPILWNPFKNGTTNYTFVIGSGECSEDGPCNAALQAETEYTFKIRGLTRNAYRDSPSTTFVTTSDRVADTELGVILGAVFGCLLAVILVVFIFILWKRKHKWIAKIQREEKKTSDLPSPVPSKQFLVQYDDINAHNAKLKAEYTLLGTKTAEVVKSTSVAQLSANRSKNRYTNIMPFDETRVVLNLEENESDYINASYILGFSDKIEYIATQGPLESTCVDFWQMVIQENVTIIAMLAQFVEQNKQKCYKYFPENRDTIIVGEDIEVRCAAELNFGSYVVRTLFVTKDRDLYTVTHLQFTDWPDFGCPYDTSNLLTFCHIMRGQHTKDGGKIVVHCSAGVGRTGTLIAIDILLQAINAKKGIDVFGTVLNLRKQRPNMVQTEKQYLYIYRCINDAIENPIKIDSKITEPMYDDDSAQLTPSKKIGFDRQSIVEQTEI